MITKWLVVGIILLFVGTYIIPAIAQDTEKLLPVIRGKWLYVGGSGPGNYSKIQYAVHDANDGDTVFVYDDSSPYYENIKITKSINLIGENKNTTTIIGNGGSGPALSVQKGNVTITGFTVKDGFCAIELPSGYTTVYNNNVETYTDILSQTIGIDVRSSNNSILYNTISSFGNKSRSGIGTGIDGVGSNNTIEYNTIMARNSIGIKIYGDHNLINNNLIIQDYATTIYLGTMNVISNNVFEKGGLRFFFDRIPEYNNIISNNTVNGNPLIFLENTSNKIIDSTFGQVILVRCENIMVKNQNFSDLYCGIQVFDSTNCQIVNNTLLNSSNWYSEAIGIYYSDTIMVKENKLMNSIIRFEFCNNIVLSKNILIREGASYGEVDFYYCDNCSISYNHLVDSELGLYICRNCSICCNNFIMNKLIYKLTLLDLEITNFSNITFYRNYWWRPRLLPKPILVYVHDPENPYVSQRQWYFDWRPALKPYDIGG
jgi:hypothetical protein